MVISFILDADIDISTTNNTVASVTLKLFTCLRIAINSQVPSLLLDLMMVSPLVKGGTHREHWVEREYAASRGHEFLTVLGNQTSYSG